MALSGNVASSGYEGRYIQFNWSATQSVANNTSTITWELRGAGQGQVGWYMAGGFKVIIDGNTVYSVSTDSRIQLYNGTLIASGTKTISHNSDGTRSFGVYIEAGIYTYAVNCSGSGNFALNTIPRASSISVGTLTMGTAGNISVSKASSGFTHTIEYFWGDTSNAGISAGRGYKGTICTKSSSTNISWTPSKNLANVIPSATSGNGTLTCTTYSGNTNVGSKSITFKCLVPSDIVPTLSSMSAVLDNSANSVINSWGIGVAGYSKVKIVASAAGSYKSVISSFAISGGYSSTKTGTSLNWTGDTIGSSGAKTFTVKATDSRTRVSAEKSASIIFYAYSVPSISSFVVNRSSTNAKKIVVRGNWSFASVNGNNDVTATLQYKRTTSSSWTTYGSIAKNTNVTLTTDFLEESSYNFRLIIRDSVGNSAQDESYVSTLEVLMDFRAGGKGLGIGKIAETDSMEVAMLTKFMKDIYIYVDNSPITLKNYIKGVMAGTY